MNLAAVRRGVPLSPRTRLGLAEMALVALLALQAARLIWLVAVPAHGPAGPPGPPAMAPAAQTEILARFDPFFRLAQSDLATGAGPAGDLHLYGVRSGGAAATAILGPPGGAQTLYRIGEQGPDGITLIEVSLDHVVIAQGAARRRIGFPVPAGHGAITAPATQSAAPQTPTEAPPTFTGAQLMAALALTPRLRLGRPVGFTVSPRGAAGAAVLAQAGLQSGDVLLTLDGSELNRERLSELPQILAAATHVDLSYERGGQTLTTRLRMSAP